jgi:CysZ protein
MVSYAPFLDGLVSRTIRIETGEAREGEMGLIPVMIRAILMTVYTTIASLGVAIFGFALGFVPLVGPVLSFLFAFPLQMFLCAVSSVDPCLERYDRSARDTIRLMWRHRAKMTLFGLISTIGMFIPLVGWIVSPTYSLAAGVVLGMELEGDEVPPPTTGQTAGDGVSCKP